MRLSHLLDGLEPIRWVRARDDVDPLIRGICYDSRRVAPGDLFVALTGGVTSAVKPLP